MSRGAPRSPHLRKAKLVIVDTGAGRVSPPRGSGAPQRDGMREVFTAISDHCDCTPLAFRDPAGAFASVSIRGQKRGSRRHRSGDVSRETSKFNASKIAAVISSTPYARLFHVKHDPKVACPTSLQTAEAARLWQSRRFFAHASTQVLVIASSKFCCEPAIRLDRVRLSPAFPNEWVPCSKVDTGSNASSSPRPSRQIPPAAKYSSVATAWVYLEHPSGAAFTGPERNPNLAEHPTYARTTCKDALHIQYPWCGKSGTRALCEPLPHRRCLVRPVSPAYVNPCCFVRFRIGLALFPYGRPVAVHR